MGLSWNLHALPPYVLFLSVLPSWILGSSYLYSFSFYWLTQLVVRFQSDVPSSTTFSLSLRWVQGPTTSMPPP